MFISRQRDHGTCPSHNVKHLPKPHAHDLRFQSTCGPLVTTVSLDVLRRLEIVMCGDGSRFHTDGERYARQDSGNNMTITAVYLIDTLESLPSPELCAWAFQWSHIKDSESCRCLRSSLVD